MIGPGIVTVPVAMQGSSAQARPGLRVCTMSDTKPECDNTRQRRAVTCHVTVGHVMTVTALA
eukprot:393373-Rhodomonas_salina.1